MKNPRLGSLISKLQINLNEIEKEMISINDELSSRLLGGLILKNSQCTNESCSSGTNEGCTNPQCTGGSNDTCSNPGCH